MVKETYISRICVVVFIHAVNHIIAILNTEFRDETINYIIHTKINRNSNQKRYPNLYI